MSDEAALLAAIRAHPDEDTPRLIYADWLQENGQAERGEFIRLQHISEFERTAEQGRRHDHLEQAFRAAWTASLPPGDWRFTRGLPEVLICDARDYVNSYTKLTTGTFIRELFLRNVESVLPEIAYLGWPTSVAVLTLQYDERGAQYFLGPDNVRSAEELVQCEHLRGVRELNLRGCAIGSDAARALGALAHLKQLTRFDLSGCALPPESLSVLRPLFGPRLHYSLSLE